jgi:hypothetical protein
MMNSFILAELYDDGFHLVDSSVYITKSFTGMYNGARRKALGTRCSVKF